MFLLKSVDGAITYDIDGWRQPFIRPSRLANNPYMYMQILSAPTEVLYEHYKKVLNSVDDGFLTIGYYDCFDHDKVGYIHSSKYLTTDHLFKYKNMPPCWFELKLFC